MQDERELDQEFGGAEEEIVPEDNEDNLEPEEGPEPDTDDPDGEDKPEPDEDEKEKRRKKNLGQALKRAHAEKYQALERIRLLEENLRQAQIAAERSSEAAMRSYDAEVIHKVAIARQKLQEAKELGDSQAEIDAQISLNLATNELQKLQDWKAQQEMQQEWQKSQSNIQQPQTNPNVNPYEYHQEETEEWITRNADWFHPEGENYDPYFAQETSRYSEALNQLLMERGYGHLIGSQEYYDTIDNQIALARQRLQQSYQKHQPYQRGPQMKSVRAPVAPSRGSMNRVTPSSKKPLSAAERDMIRGLGVTEEAYRQSQASLRRAGKL